MYARRIPFRRLKGCNLKSITENPSNIVSLQSKSQKSEIKNQENQESQGETSILPIEGWKEELATESEAIVKAEQQITDHETKKHIKTFIQYTVHYLQKN